MLGGVNHPFRQVGALGVAQTIAWASSYYLPAIITTSIARDLKSTPPIVLAAFSLALVISALLGQFAGRAIDRLGGRPVLVFSNFIFAAGLFALSRSLGLSQLFFAWGLIGTAMSCGLYEAAFATLVRLQGEAAKGAITGITLIAGFASTIGWPLTSLMQSHVGWRGACLGWALLHLTLGIALNASLPNTRRDNLHLEQPSLLPPANVTQSQIMHQTRTEILLAYVFAVTWFISTSMAVHLPRLLQSTGMATASVVTVAALVGPAQIAGRLLEFGFLSRWHSLVAARIAALLHPLGALTLLFIGATAAPVFSLLHGTGNGILTIAQGTLPLALFGTHGYGRRQGLLMLPARFAQASAPFLYGICIERWGAAAVVFSGSLGLSCFGALMIIRVPMKGETKQPAL